MKCDLSKITCIEDLRLVAKRKMPRMFYDYIDSGSWTETTYRENTSDFKDIRFRQKVLVNMEGRSLETKIIEQIDMVDSVNGIPNFSAARAAKISPSACAMPV